MTDLNQLSLENFVYWFIQAQPDDKFAYRHNICETVRQFGKEKVLDELERQASNFKNIEEAVIIAQIIKGMKI